MSNKYKKTIISQDTLSQIITYYLSGKSVRWLSDNYPYGYSVLQRVIRENGIEIRGNDINSRRYDFNENYFDELDTPDKAYWLGFIYADGYISKLGNESYKLGISLSSVDSGHIVKFRKCIDSNHKIPEYETVDGSFKIGSKYSRISIHSKHLCEQLISKGVLLNKTYVVTFPYDIIPNQYMRDFIRGYVDGDGCISYHTVKGTNRTAFRLKLCGTSEMLNGILDTLPTKEKYERPKLYKRYKDRDVNNYQFDIGGNRRTLEVLDYLYEDSSIYLDRKYERYLMLKNMYN